METEAVWREVFLCQFLSTKLIIDWVWKEGNDNLMFTAIFQKENRGTLGPFYSIKKQVNDFFQEGVAQGKSAATP